MTHSANDRSWLAALDEDDAMYWRPERVDDTVIGTVRKIYVHRGGYGSYTVLLLETDMGLVNLRCNVTVLRNKVDELQPQPGDNFAVRYIGPQTSTTGRTYQGFRVAHHRPDPRTDIDFDPTVEDPWRGSVA